MRAPLDDALEVAAPIVADVRERGDAALLEWTERFDGPRPEGFRVAADRIATATVDGRRARGAPPHDPRGRAVQRGPASRRHDRSRPRRESSRSAAGCRSTAVGLCVPSGRTPLPSSLVMTAVPARVAGVARIAVVTPDPAEATLVVARELGIDEVYAVGGAQAVAALAYGTETIPAVDAIVGPGNAYVTAAKLLVSSRVRIDLPAGPSEVVVIADATADAGRVAADLLAQAEHGPDSDALLLTRRFGARRRPWRRVVAGHAQRARRARRVARRGARALGGLRARAPRAARRRRDARSPRASAMPARSSSAARR